MLDDILAQIQHLDPLEIIRRFDADFDTPGRAGDAVGLLRLANAFLPGPEDEAQAVRVGAHWCALILDDVQFDLAHALAVIDESEADAAQLAAEGAGGAAAYCLARWYDGAGKVLYRIGSHARGRMDFTLATATARSHDLWWCLADLESNWLRGRLEEARQAGADALAADVLTELEEAVTRSARVGSDAGIRLSPVPVRSDDYRHREHMRGHSSLLHNLSFAVRKDDPARSLALSRQAGEISRVLQDAYRQAQALNHQGIVIKESYARLNLRREDADHLFRQVQGLGWQRGRRIAEQQIALGHDDPLTGARELAVLLKRIDAETGRLGRAAGLDTDLRWFTVDAFESLAIQAVAKHPHDRESEKLLDEARQAKLLIARSVRRVIALPAYKRAYGSTVRPIYQDRIGRILDELSGDHATAQERREEVLSLVEESTGRELLDLISSVDLPTLTAPPAASTIAEAADAAAAASASAVARSPLVPPPGPGTTVTAGHHHTSAPPDKAVPAGRITKRRRRLAPSRRSTPQQEALDRAVLVEREREFEQQFLNRPLQAAPHDEEIARRATMFVANHPGTRFIRYFSRGWYRGEPEELGAFVIGETISRPIELGPYRRGKQLVAKLLSDEMPSPELSDAIWQTLLAPLWPEISEGLTQHLVVVPTDDLFAIPFHIAAEDAGNAGARPLAARFPLSQTVSLTAFLTRGRHLLRRQLTADDDDLAAVIVEDGIKATEIVGTGWDAAHVHVAGDIPEGLQPGYEKWEANWAGLRAVTACRPEFFVYAGHGNYVEGFGEFGPYLQLRGPDRVLERLTSYDVALRVRLPRNILTLIGACLAGQGASTPGGDVAGFVRAFMAAGAGAIGLPLWPVDDEDIALASRSLLRASRPPGGHATGVFDVVEALHEHYKIIAGAPGWWARMPLVLYT